MFFLSEVRVSYSFRTRVSELWIHMYFCLTIPAYSVISSVSSLNFSHENNWGILQCPKIISVVMYRCVLNFNIVDSPFYKINNAYIFLNSTVLSILAFFLATLIATVQLGSEVLCAMTQDVTVTAGSVVQYGTIYWEVCRSFGNVVQYGTIYREVCRSFVDVYMSPREWLGDRTMRPVITVIPHIVGHTTFDPSCIFFCPKLTLFFLLCPPPSGYPLFGFYLNQTLRPMIYSCSWPVYQTYSGITVRERARVVGIVVVVVVVVVVVRTLT